MRIIITIVLLWTSNFLMGQSYQSKNFANTEVLEEIELSPELTESSAVINDTNEDILPQINSSFNDKQWKKIKKKIKKNKKRFLNSDRKNTISKTLDTIYLNSPSSKEKTQISEL